MPTLSLTDRSVDTLPFIQGGQVDYRDAELAGFFVRVGARSKTYMVQGDLRDGTSKKQTIKIKIGLNREISARDARSKAKRILGEILEGIDPRPKPEPKPENAPDSATLRTAWSVYLVSHLQRKNRSQATIDDYRDHVDRLLAEWLDKPLRDLGDEPILVKEMHDRITKDNGPYIANSCMRTFRAIYTHARKTARDLQKLENPVFAVDWNPEKRRDTGMGPEDLPGWFAQARALDNPLRRELHLFLLLSGSRPDAVKKVRLEHIYLSKRLIFIPSPKGGEEKAFCIQLSRQMIRCIARALRFGRMMHPGEAQEWLFPAESESGHISEHKEDRAKLSHWGNELRQTYRTMGQVAGISEIDMHLLMNHSLPGVNAGYITRLKLNSHLREAQQLLSDLILEGATHNLWPQTSARVQLQGDIPAKLDVERGQAHQRCSRNLAVFRDMASAA